MNDAPDHELLRCHADGGSDEAFTELVRRHCDLVWAAARRVSGDGEIARDVSQNVFTDLARKAGKLPPGTVLAGWLYRAACLEAAGHIRCAARRAEREQHAMRQHELHAADATEALAVAELQPVLDAALAELSDADRDAVVLRFLAGRSLAEVGATLGTNEDAAQKRVGRALEKLREAFRQRGIAVSGGLVAAALGMAGTQAAPIGLAASVAKASMGSVAVASWWATLTGVKAQVAVLVVLVPVAAVLWQRMPKWGHAIEAVVAQDLPEPTVAGFPAAKSIAPVSPDRTAEIPRLHAELSRRRASTAIDGPEPIPASTPERGELEETPRLRAEAPGLRQVGVVSGSAGRKLKTISGRVVLHGTPPPERPILGIMNDPNAARFHQTAPLTRTFVVSTNGGLADVFVRISSGLENQSFSAPTNQPLIDMVGTLFYPPVVAAMAGQPFRIRNSDPLLHNINATPKANRSFNIAMANKGQVNVISFAAPEEFIRLACNVHPWEIGYICVAPNPFFCMTDTNGVFELPSGLPAGTYEVEATHRKAGTVKQSVQFDGEKALVLQLDLQVP